MTRNEKLVQPDPFEVFRSRSLVKRKEDEFRRISRRRTATEKVTRRIARRQEEAKARREDTRCRRRRKRESTDCLPPLVVEDYFNTGKGGA